MKVNGVPVVNRLTNEDESITLEPIVYENDLLIPIGFSHNIMYFKIPGKLIKEVVDANTPHVNKVKR